MSFGAPSQPTIPAAPPPASPATLANSNQGQATVQSKTKAAAAAAMGGTVGAMGPGGSLTPPSTAGTPLLGG